VIKKAKLYNDQDYINNISKIEEHARNLEEQMDADKNTKELY
jgi:hypothetical protein